MPSWLETVFAGDVRFHVRGGHRDVGHDRATGIGHGSGDRGAVGLGRGEVSGCDKQQKKGEQLPGVGKRSAHEILPCRRLGGSRGVAAQKAVAVNVYSFARNRIRAALKLPQRRTLRLLNDHCQPLFYCPPGFPSCLEFTVNVSSRSENCPKSSPRHRATSSGASATNWRCPVQR